MKNLKKVLLALLLACSPLLGQTNAREQIHQVFALEKQGRFDQAIAILAPFTESGQVSGVELGRVWIILGVIYNQQGKFMEAQKAFEHALRILERDPRYAADYSVALQNYGALYNDARQMATAAQMWGKALALRRQVGDHTGVTRSLTSLAGLALAQNRLRDAKKYLQSAAEEAKLANDLIEDDLAITAEAQAWLALAEGRASDAVADYQRALEICKRIHGERHWLTGWDYMLRGKAYAQLGDVKKAFSDMEEGLAILDETLGRKNPRYFAAQFAYSEVLDRAGLHSQAAHFRAAAELAKRDFDRCQCVGCTISVAAFR